MTGTGPTPQDLLEQERFEEAGTIYTVTAYRTLGHREMANGDDRQISGGLDRLLRATLSYRRAGRMDRCQNRAEQGILIARDIQENVVEDPRRVAVLQEFIADFHGISGLEGYQQAYDDTLVKLRDADLEYSTSFLSSPLADKIIGFTFYLEQFADNEIGEVAIQFDFADRVRYKKREMQGIRASIDQNTQ